VTEMELAIAMQHVAAREMHAFRMAEMVDGNTNLSTKPSGRRRKASWTFEDYNKCAQAGMSRKECAAHLGVDVVAVNYMVREYGVKFQDARRKKA
jgi:hypothetical protein